MIGKVFAVALVIGTAILIYGVVNNYFVGLEYQRVLGKHFEYADRASDAITKAEYFNAYVSAIENEGLTEGCSAVFFCEQPNASLTDNYKVALSLQTRLNDIAEMNPKSMEYANAMDQITLKEFCYFPTNAFGQGYMLKHGAWGAALVPLGVYDRC